jgi:hypothetical protein
MAKQPSKPPKIPRPPKPPIAPARRDEELNLTIGLNHERLIDRVIVAWSKLEGVMEDLIWHFLGLQIEQGRIVTGRLDATAKIKMIRALAEPELSETHWHRLSPILDRIDILREERNTIAHGTWGRNSQGIPIAISLKFNPLAPDEVVSEAFPDVRLRAIAYNIDASKFKLMILMRDIRAVPEIHIPILDEK